MAILSGNMGSIPLASNKGYTPFHTKPTWEEGAWEPLLPAGEELLLTDSPSFPKPAFLVGQEPKCQACLQEELQGCSWENRSSDTQHKEPNPSGGFQT